MLQSCSVEVQIHIDSVMLLQYCPRKVFSVLVLKILIKENTARVLHCIKEKHAV